MPDAPKPAEHPVVFVKGRGAGSNRPSRYVKDEWDEAADFDPATRKTEVTRAPGEVAAEQERVAGPVLRLHDQPLSRL